MTEPIHDIRIGLAVCTPMPFVRLPNGQHRMDDITVKWHRKRQALSTPTNFNLVEIYCDGMEVGDARNEAVRRCLAHDPVPEFLFFLDNDVLPEFDAITKLLYRARHLPQYDVYAGVYCAKWMSPPEPLIYQGNGTGPFWDWTLGDILTTDAHKITGTHMGLTLIRLSLFDDLPWDEDNPWFVSTNEKVIDNGAIKTRRGTEDLYFYKTAKERGREVKICVDTSVLAAHIDKKTGQEFGLPWDCKPVKNQKALYSKDEEYKEEKKALDLGCGPTHRQWKGHKTYRLDIRPEVEPDYCQDTRKLNLPDNHFDLCASSHHLEHIPRWEQEEVWKEIFRITKPGGHIEHIVPSLDWAGFNVFDGRVDEHVMNVLYGAQESHGYDRQYNLHYFGYTKQVARDLAESVGFVDVELEDWRENEKNGYNLIIRGRKPEPGEKPKKSARKPSSNGRAKKPQKKTATRCNTTRKKAVKAKP